MTYVSGTPFLPGMFRKKFSNVLCQSCHLPFSLNWEGVAASDTDLDFLLNALHVLYLFNRSGVPTSVNAIAVGSLLLRISSLDY